MQDDPQRQLTASWLNIIAAGLVSGGTVSQLAAVIVGASPVTGAALILACIAVGIALHLMARRCIGRSIGESLCGSIGDRPS